MDTEQIKILLERYNQGNCSPEEADIIERWFQQINSRQSTVVDEPALDLQLEEVKLRINEQMAPAPRVRSMRAWYWSAAAAAIIALAAGLFWFNNPRQPAGAEAGKPLAQLPANGSNRVVKDGFVIITTPKGYRENITLEDGSTISLNAGTRLRFPEKFSDSTRNIFLEDGEALFHAAPDAKRRFVVHTADITTTALGTSFNIRAYNAETKVTVALITGKVKIDQLKNNQITSLVLMPSEQISYDRQLLSMIKTSFAKPEEVTSWKQGYLVFKDAPYKEIMTSIENRYNITVINQSDKTEWNYTGNFKNESLAEVMDIICIAKTLSYTIKKDTVYLVNKN